MKYESVSMHGGYWVAIAADTQRSDGKPYFVNIYEVDPRDYKPDYSVYRDGFRTILQAIVWARGGIDRGDIPFAADQSK